MMPPVQAILAVAASGLALSLSPGPSMFFVLSRSVGQSRSAGLASAVGLAFGGVLLAIGASLGLATVLEQRPQAMVAVEVAGGLYLLYLGIEAIRETRITGSVAFEPVEPQRWTAIMKQGVLVEALNPKTALFIMAFVPGFIDETSGSTGLQLLVLSILVPLTAMPCDITVSFLGGTGADYLRRRPEASTVLAWVSGLVLCGLGLRLVIPAVASLLG